MLLYIYESASRVSRVESQRQRIKHLKNVVADSSVPDKCYSDLPDGKSGNRKLAVGCVYCEHKRDCWSDVNGGQGLR